MVGPDEDEMIACDVWSLQGLSCFSVCTLESTSCLVFSYI